MDKSENKRATEAADVLNDFVGDFITGVMVFREYSQQFHLGKIPFEAMIPIQKMCLSNVVMALFMFEEFYKHYHEFIPESRRQACKNILKEIKSRKVKDFRNKYGGHIWDKDKQRPLTQSEMMSALSELATPDFESFLDWINNPSCNIYPKTVVSVVETVRDELRSR